MGAMTVAVLGRAGAVAVATERGIDVGDEVRMRRVDPGIEDGDTRPGAGESLVVGIRRGRVRSPDPGDAGRDRLGSDPDRAVGDDVADGWALLEGLGLLGRSAEHEPAQRVFEDAASLPAGLLREARSRGPRVDAGRHADDPAVDLGPNGARLKTTPESWCWQRQPHQKGHRDKGQTATHGRPCISAGALVSR